MNCAFPPTRRWLPALGALLLLRASSWSAVFPIGSADNARLEITDSTGGLSWVQANNALTVACWVKLTIPSDTTLTGDMTILANRRTGDWNQPHAFRIYLNVTTGNIEFTARGSTGGLTPIVLIEKPYLDRWYHLGVVRSGNTYTPYVDGRQHASVNQDIGSAANTDGVVVGGLSGQQRFLGEVQEVAIYQQALSRSLMVTNMLQDISVASFPQLKGYYKLAYSVSAADNLKNFATTPPTGTQSAASQGTGTVEFPETDKQGEQSLFDSRKNVGKDALASLSGSFTWQQGVFARPTAGVPFEFNIGYNSGIGQSGQPLEGGVDVFADDAVFSRGWRHSFQTRLVAGDLFLQSSSAYVGLLTWDGSLETWQRQTGTQTFKPVHPEYRGEMQSVENGDYIEWTTPARLIFKFYHPTNWIQSSLQGRLAEVRDFNGNHLTLAYDTILGRLTSVTDSGGGLWAFAYNLQNLLSTVTGPSTDTDKKWTVTFTYDASNRLSTKAVTSPPVYTQVASTQWQFSYSSGVANGEPADLLTLIKDPRTNNDNTIHYDKFGRKISEADALNRVTTFQYNVPALRQLTATHQFGASANAANDRATVETFDRKLRLLSHKDPLAFISGYEYDAAGNVNASTDANGNRSKMTYDARSNMTLRTNAIGETSTWIYAQTTDPAGSTNGHLTGGTLLNTPLKETRPATAEAPGGWDNLYTYDGAGNLLTHADAIGTLANHTYDSRGLVMSSKDANNNETRFAYDATTGFLTSRTIAFGTAQAATWNFTSTELGWPKTSATPLSETTTLGYNINGQVVSTTDPLWRIFTKTYDAGGNLTDESDGKGVKTYYGYNVADERTTKTDRDGKLWTFNYNEFGQPKDTITPAVVHDGETSPGTAEIFTRIYDKNGRLAEERDPYYSSGTPTLHRVAYDYDNNGNPVLMTDKVGKQWKKTFDGLNRVVAEQDPVGNVRRTYFDAAGRVLTITSPNGFPARHEYDGRGRLTKWTDPEGFAWQYGYDGVGNILDITDALAGNYHMTYGPRNERLTERNQDLKTWTYTYDLLARLATQSDPNGTSRTLYYDPASRLDYVEFGTGRINALGYDDNNNVRSLTRSKPGSPPTSLLLDYDALDRLTDSHDTFSKTVHYGYDALSRVFTKTYPGGKVLTHAYDRLGRLKKLSFAYSGTPFDCTFAYDDAGRLTDRTYPNGITQHNVFDDDGRLTSLGYAGTATPALALTYAYDSNGNKTGGNETGTLNWQTASLSNYAETARYTPAGKLIDRTDSVPPTPKVLNYQYDFSGNMTQATGGGETYTLAYDEDNRTTSILYDNGLTAKNIANRYDALGRRVSRKLDGTETRYVLDLIGGMERILCDTGVTGAVKAWYVHGPDLCFKVTDTGALTCYHADATGNIIRTTGPSGATINQYAYTPYGRSLDTNSANITDPSDPYRFVGSQGVMQELPGLYFMRARYYSAEAAVFLSTDPVKKIGPGWQPNAYGYAETNPFTMSDPDGNVPIYAFWKYEQAFVKPINQLMQVGVTYTNQFAGITSEEEMEDRLNHQLANHSFEKLGLQTILQSQGVPGAGFIAGQVYDTEKSSYASTIGNSIPGSQTGQAVFNAGRIVGNIAIGSVTRSFAWAMNAPMPSNGGTYANSTPATIGGFGQVSSLSNRSAGASTVATVTNSSQTTKPAATTSTGGGSGGSGSASTSGGGGSISYTVKAGDTLGNIGYKFGSTATAIGKASGISNLNSIRPGQVVTIPRR